MTPLDMYMSRSSKVKPVEDPGALDMLFLKREHRKVKHDGTILVNSRLFEVPPQFTGRRVEVRFDPENTGQVYVYDDGKMITKARPVNLKDNALVKR